MPREGSVFLLYPRMSKLVFLYRREVKESLNVPPPLFASIYLPLYWYHLLRLKSELFSLLGTSHLLQRKGITELLQEFSYYHGDIRV